MGFLAQLVGSKPRRPYRGPGYLPFTEPRYPGPYPVSSAGRYTSAISNALLSKAFLRSNSALPLPSDSLSYIQDRRRWSPYSVALDTFGVPVAPTDLITVDPSTKTPYDPKTGEIFVPRKRRTRWDGNLEPWRPGEFTKLKYGPWWYGFANADRVVICLHRKMRREIMHAMGFAGRTGQRRPHFNQYSHVRCW